MKEKDQEFDSLLKEITSLPEPDYNKKFDADVQNRMLNQLIDFSVQYEKKKKVGAIMKNIAFSVTGVVAVILFVVLISTTNLWNSGDGGNSLAFQEFKQDDWTLDSEFEHGSITFLGKPGEIGVANFWDETNAFLVNSEHHIIVWRLYGDPEAFEHELKEIGTPDIDYGDRFRIVGVHKETVTEIDFLEGKEISIVPFSVDGYRGVEIQENNITFPKEGTWSLSVFINNKLFNSVVIEVTK